MKNIPDSVKIDSISMPGTHDSSTYLKDYITGAGFVKTQVDSISDQLKNGVRYLDIRLRHIQNVFALHHEQFFLDLFFDDVLKQTCDFLAANPSETVLMRLKKEYKDQDNSRTFEQTFKTYLSKYSNFFWKYNGNNNPNIGMIRGKIVILQDFAGSLYGLDFSSFNIQDNYSVSSLNSKKSSVLEFYRKAGKTRRIISHLSSYGAIGYLTPGENSGPVNDFMSYLIRTNNPAYVGIIPADFPDKTLISVVIATNFYSKLM